MIACPNFANPEVKSRWDAIQNDPELGRIEAVREYLAAEREGREMGTPEEVKQKLDLTYRPKSEVEQQSRRLEGQKEILSKSNDPVYDDPDTLMGLAILSNPINGKNLSVANTSKTRGMEIVRKLSEATGINFAFVTPEEAIRITANTKNPYSVTKSPAFFYGDTVYFVGEAVNAELAFHEFSHPIVRLIQKQNPLLFEKLYNQALLADPSLLDEALNEYEDLRQAVNAESDPEAKAQIEERYKRQVAEEILVKALTKASLQKANVPVPTGFSKVINDILYAIKQALRKLFGQKINISKLDANTTLDELAQMLAAGGNFEINTESVSDQDVVAYFEGNSRYIEDLKNIADSVGNQKIQTMVKRIYEGSSQQIYMMMKNKNYQEMINLFVDEYNRGDLQEMRSNVAKYANELMNKTQELYDEMEQTRNEMQGLVNSILRLEKMMEKMEKHLQELSKDPENQDNIHKAYYYSHVLSYWQKYIAEAQATLREGKADPRSPMSELLNSIEETMKRSAITINQMNTHGITDVLWEQWQPLAEQAEETFKGMIDTLKKKGASQKMLDKRYTEFYGMPESFLEKFQELKDRKAAGETLSYDEIEMLESLEKKSQEGLNITKEKVKKALKGEGKDANWANSYLEGYLYNTDPVIGGFAMYFKNNMAEMEQRAQVRYNDIAKELEPLLKAAGVSFTRIGDLGQKIGFVDKIGIFDQKTKSFVEKEVWTLLNPWKNYRYDVDKFDHDIRELQKRYNKTGSDADKQVLAEKIAEKAAHMRKYFHQEYVEEYYAKDDLLERDDVGRKAAYERKKILEKIGELNHPMMSEYDALKNVGEIDEQWKKYRLLYSSYYPNGEKKTGEDLAIAERLQEHREHTRKFYEFKERPGVFENALRNFENEAFQRLKGLGLLPGSKQFEDLFNEDKKQWLERNTRVAIKPEFYAQRSKILARIKAITSKLPSAQANEIDFSDYWKTIIDVVSAYRDDDGQPKGNELSDGRKSKVKEAQQAMEAAKEKWAGFSGLTRVQMDTLVTLAEKKNKGEYLTADQWATYRELIGIQDELGLNEFERAELNSLFADLKELQRKEPTEYYLDSINFWMEKLDTEDVYKELSITGFDESNIEKLYKPSVLEKLFAQSEEFKNWFEANHVTKSFYNKEEGRTEKTYERLYVWNVIKPNNPDFYETTTVTKEDGTPEHIPGLPKLKFYARVVKREYRTGYNPQTGEVKKQVGVHIDNRGEYLPKDVEGSPYRNEEYFKLQKENPKLFAVLENMTKWHLKNQEGIGKRGKLYMDFPRFEKSALEWAQSGGIGKKAKDTGSRFGLLLKKLRDFFKGAKETGEHGFNWRQENELVRADAFNDQIENLPIQGIFNLTKEETSTDIITSMMRYMYGVEHHKQLVKMNPVAQGIKKVLGDPNNHLSEPDKVNLSNFVNNGEITYIKKKGKYIRKQAFENFYEREFMAQTTTGWGSETAWVQNLQKTLMKRASFSFFALNVPSALKNQIGAKFQAMIESAAGSNVTLATMARGEAWSSKYMFKLSFGDAYQKGQKSLEHQIGEIFDPIQGRFHEKFGESITRTMGKDIASMSWLYNFQKWTEVQASMQTFGGMMYKKKVKQGDKDIDYMDAWELDPNGQVTLKKGIDVRYSNQSTVFAVAEGDTLESLAERFNMSTEDLKKALGKKTLEPGKELKIDNTEFKKFRSRIHMVMNKLNGAYSKFDQPEMQRYLAFRFLSFLRRYFVTMAMNRFGKKRWNPGYGEIDEGYYLTAVKAFWSVISNRNFHGMDTEARKALMKITAEIGSLIILGVLIGTVWGWDDDDDERYEKLRQMSGPAGWIPGVAESDREFDLGGFISLHMLNLTMQVRSENEQFIPWPGYGIDNMSTIIDLKSLVFGPTTDTYGEIFHDVRDWWEGSDRQFYKRRVGAYEWQQQGGRKLWAHIAKAFGVTGSSVDPAQGITNFDKAQNRNR